MTALLFAALLAPALADEPATTWCSADETVRFHCTVKGGKWLSLCASKELTAEAGTLQYRFGAPDKRELTFPAEPGRTEFSWRVDTHAQSRSFHVLFANEGVHYDVFDQMTEGSSRDHGAGVVVSKDGKDLATVLCDTEKPTTFAIAELEGVLATKE